MLVLEFYSKWQLSQWVNVHVVDLRLLLAFHLTMGSVVTVLHIPEAIPCLCSEELVNCDPRLQAVTSKP